MNTASSGYTQDPELGGNFSAFDDQNVRRGFIRKVYGILMVQLLITLAFISIFVYNDSVKLYSQQHPEMYWISFALVFGCMIALSCCGDLRRKTPHNYICLFIFTLCEGFMLGSVSSYFKSEEVVLAVGICAIVSLALTLFAFQTKWDFTLMGGMLFVGLIILLIFGIFTIFFHSRIVVLIYASLGALLFSFYLVYDTQLMLGGNHKYSISPEEYIFAALNLYLDIINLFITWGWMQCRTITRFDRLKLGNREIVGFGTNGSPIYMDRFDSPFPAIKWKETTPELQQLHEKEKGDWNKLSIEEKKELYRWNYCQTFSEFCTQGAPEWKLISGAVMWLLGCVVWLWMWIHIYVLGPGRALSFDLKHQQAMLRFMIDTRVSGAVLLSQGKIYR
ncbi:unnamed protein product [Cyprideis torosa]|uniref:Uncharacterized protein n=1 Tax=Cyprideis torosa TaxID=163714 RepID=A0A7R8ZHB1_9CRUS|nr:unnamed protein product [Cyprideis torosa]CAG0883259.1 unnamed protein product [Cyprideis torosa]